MVEVTLNRIIRKRDLYAFTGLKRTSLEQLIKSGAFPRPVPLVSNDGRAVGWIESELVQWQLSRIAARDVGGAVEPQPEQERKYGE